MAKRVPPDQKPFRPVDEALIRSVMAGPPAALDEVAVGGGVAVAAPIVAAPTRREASLPEPTYIRPLPAAPLDDRLPATAKRAEVPAPLRRSDPIPNAIPTDASLDRRDREKRVLLTLSEERDVERLVTRLAGELRTPVKLSHMLRACITIVLHAEEELVERSRRTTLVRPGNGNAPELAEFEHGLSQVLATALREARPLR
jgi:hypothetical protein